MVSGISIKMNFKTKAPVKSSLIKASLIKAALLTVFLLNISFTAHALSQEEITDAATFAISDMEQLSSDLTQCNSQIEIYRSSRALQTEACLMISRSFENHLASFKRATDLLTTASLDIRVEEERSIWWENQKKLSERLKNSRELLKMDMQRHMEILKKYRIQPNPDR